MVIAVVEPGKSQCQSTNKPRQLTECMFALTFGLLSCSLLNNSKLYLRINSKLLKSIRFQLWRNARTSLRAINKFHKKLDSNSSVKSETKLSENLHLALRLSPIFHYQTFSCCIAWVTGGFLVENYHKFSVVSRSRGQSQGRISRAFIKYWTIQVSIIQQVRAPSERWCITIALSSFDSNKICQFIDCHPRKVNEILFVAKAAPIEAYFTSS